MDLSPHPDTPQPRLIWDAATGYDFFVSLHVLHSPDEFALRGAWAKGVRSRLPAAERDFLEKVSPYLLSALPWVRTLDEPKSAETVLAGVAALPPRERFLALLKTPEISPSLMAVLDRIAAAGSWSPQDREAVHAAGKYKDSAAELQGMLDLWAQAGDLGEQALPALQAYFNVFFAEEQERIQPALRDAVERGRQMAEKLPFNELLAELSEGIRFEETELVFPVWVMVPSFWITPRILVTRLNQQEGLFIHGGRPADAALVPGEAVPDALYITLKALADPTRLRILHYLEEAPQTPSELAQTLRLRPPTVIHHLNSLRLAGLVYVTYGKGDRRYAARTSRVAEMYLQLRRYLGITELHRLEDAPGRPPYVA